MQSTIISKLPRRLFFGFLLSLATVAMAQTAHPIKSQIYESFRVTKAVEIETVPAPGARVPSVRITVQLSAGMEVSLLGADHVSGLGDIIRIGLDSRTALVKADFWVRANDLLKAGLVPSEITFEQELPTLSESDYPTQPSLSSQDLAGIQKTLAVASHAGFSFRYVKHHLLKTGRIKAYLPGIDPWTAHATLPLYGLTKTNRAPSDAIIGDVCVYGGGPGHIEIKREEGWWFGYGYGPAHKDASHSLLGCFASPTHQI